MAYPPDFFSSLTQGFMYGGQLKREEEERKRRDAMQTLQTILAMQQSGAARAGDVNSYVQANQQWLPQGLQGLEAQKVQPELRQDITQGTTMPVPMISASFGTPITIPIPTAGGKMVTSDQRRAAGLPSYEELEAERLGNVSRQQNIAQGTQALTIGEQQRKLGEEELSPQATQARSVKRLSEIINASAMGYVDKAIPTVGGWQKIAGDQSGKLIQAVGDKAYKEFEAKSGITMDDSQKELTRSLIQSAALDRQLQYINAQASLLSAQYRLSMGGASALDRLIDDVAKRLDQNWNRTKELEQMVGTWADRPETEIPELMRGKVAEYRRLLKEKVNLQTAQARLIRGDMNVSQYLEPVTDGTAQVQQGGVRDMTPAEFEMHKRNIESIPRGGRDDYLRNQYRAGILSLNDLKKFGVTPQ